MSPTILVQLTDHTDSEPTDDVGVDPLTEYALARAERDGGIVHAVAIVDTGRYGEPALSSAEVLVDECEDEGHRRLAAFAARATARGVDVETRCCHGRPNDHLVEYAREIGADVAVLDRRLPHAVRESLRRDGVAIERPGRTAPAPA